MPIAILICYFGNIPWYFKFFAKSCSYNADIDFIIVTDIDFKQRLPENIIVVKCSPEDIRRRAYERLSFQIWLGRPYKLCDLKPAYGLIFSDLLEKYAFWGHGDIDLIYGNIRSFITEDLLNKYDFISVRKEYVSGFFSLFRNNEIGRNLFRESKDFKKVFQEPLDYCFDECNWEWVSLLNGKTIFELPTQIQSMTHVIKGLERSGGINAYFDTLAIEEVPGKLEWDRGKLLFDQQEVLLYHLIKFKKLPFFHIPKWKNVPDKFYINSFYFSTWSPGSTKGRILRYLLTFAGLGRVFFRSVIQYMEWCRRYISASKRVKKAEIPGLDKIVGNYRAQLLLIDIVLINDCMYGTFGGESYPLLHIRDNLFVLSKWRYQGLLNIGFAFQLDESIAEYYLEITALGSGPFILVKVRA